MNKIMESQIMEYAYHQFLYGEKSDERTEFLKGMSEHYSIVFGENKPMGIYLEKYGISLYESEKVLQNEKDQLRLKITAREYLKNYIVYSIFSKIESTNSVMNIVEEDLIKYINEECLSSGKLYRSVSEFLNDLKEYVDICLNSYISILKVGEPHPKMFEFVADFRDLGQFGKSLQKILKNDSQFNIIIDYKDEVVVNSIKAIMSIVNTRSVNSICMKIGTDFKSWPVYCDLTGIFVQCPHDYTTEELDESLRNEVEKIKAKRLDEN